MDLDADSKAALYAKVKEMRDEVAAKLQVREKTLAEKLDELKNKGKPAKKPK